MKTLHKFKVGDLVKYSDRAMKVISYNNDWYEDIDAEVSHERFLIVETIDSFSLNVYNSKTQELQKFYGEDLEKVQGVNDDKNSVQR